MLRPVLCLFMVFAFQIVSAEVTPVDSTVGPPTASATPASAEDTVPAEAKSFFETRTFEDVQKMIQSDMQMTETAFDLTSESGAG
jgi:hypothetical protein